MVLCSHQILVTSSTRHHSTPLTSCRQLLWMKPTCLVELMVSQNFCSFECESFWMTNYSHWCSREEMRRKFNWKCFETVYLEIHCDSVYFCCVTFRNSWWLFYVCEYFWPVKWCIIQFVCKRWTICGESAEIVELQYDFMACYLWCGEPTHDGSFQYDKKQNDKSSSNVASVEHSPSLSLVMAKRDSVPASDVQSPDTGDYFLSPFLTYLVRNLCDFECFFRVSVYNANIKSP